MSPSAPTAPEARTSRVIPGAELRTGMTIQAITELSYEWATLDERRLKFLQNYFNGAKAVLIVEGGTRVVNIAELKSDDHLQRIVDIPATLKIARVVDGLGQFMEKHGLMKFRVVDPAAPPVSAPAAKPGAGFFAASTPAPPTPPAVPATPPAAISNEAHAQRAQKVQAAKRFLETVEVAATHREQSSTTVEEMLDQGRQGRYSSQGVESAVEEILRKGSSPAMKAIAGLKGSDQTYAHCTDMSVILQDCYTGMLERQGKKVTDPNRRFVLISGFMHDIGKSEVPKDVLESTVRFAPDSREMRMMRNHTTYGARILSEMGMNSIAINVAHYHHVKKDPALFTSYPAVPYEQVLPITRLASIVDVYQALIGRRKYKKNWVPGKAVEYVSKLKGTEFDDRMLDSFVETLGIYPVGSLVRLSTNELAFVLSIGPKEHPERPVVSVVENAEGELLTHHSLLDLMAEPDIKVEEIVDHYEHYNKSEDQAYQIFQSIRLEH
jgi:HD-GYP domain-containing protein (c-di-GMP phosphodiesterase class II)